MSEIILSNEQVSIATYQQNGVIRVNGGPGSGKTLVAVKRAIFLAKDKAYNYAEKDDRILFLYYNKSLERTIKKLFESDKDYEKVKDKIEIRNIDNLLVKDYINSNNKEFLEFVKRARNNIEFVKTTNPERKERIKNILKTRSIEFKNFTVEDAEFILSEIDWLRDCSYLTEEEYLQINRDGRGSQNPLTKNKRMEIYKILRLYRENGPKDIDLRYTDFYDLASLFLFYFEKEENKGKIKKYNHVIVDEAQDLSKIHFRFINLICEISKTSGNTISLFMDKNQSIYSKQAWISKNRTLKQVGISISKNFSLNRAYRNAKEIFDVAIKLNPEIEVGDILNDKIQNLTLTFSEDRGIKPLFLKYPDLNFEEGIKNLSKNIEILVDKFNYKYDDISVISLNKLYIPNKSEKYKTEVDRMIESLHNKGTDVTTYYSAKGTENKVIFIPSIDEFDIDKLSDRYPDKTQEEILEEFKKLLYVGMTRAKEVLIISSLKTEASDSLKKLLEVFDLENDFINIDTDFNDFYTVFNREINKNENIEKNHSKFSGIKEVIEEEKNTDIVIQKEKEALKIDINERDNIEIEKEIENKFSLAHKLAKIGLIKAEKLFLGADKNEKLLNTEGFEYLKAFECEITTCYTTIQEKAKEQYSKNEKMHAILKKLKTHHEFKNIISKCFDSKVFDKRNDLAHAYNEFTYNDLLEIRKLVMEDLLPSFIKAFNKYKINKGIDEFIIVGKLETSYNKVDIQKKKYYSYCIIDENNNSFLAFSENKYKQDITYKLTVNKLMLKGNEYYRIIEASNFFD
ncbi:UvrD-helicase domain-containing protein [Fusobacterium periodonticum]|uniref:UvrD-helicase domain-containing protein n=1 Tax=Fusobacterium periodonticum TaxID=860 RepID=UPI0028D1271C|nr:UvrD-helicase domain-containing protein [Fusobacterium periodonticum]